MGEVRELMLQAIVDTRLNGTLYAPEFVDAILSTLADAGLVIVPREPTEAMLVSVDKQKIVSGFGVVKRDAVVECWQAMISATNPDKLREEG